VNLTHRSTLSPWYVRIAGPLALLALTLMLTVSPAATPTAQAQSPDAPVARVWLSYFGYGSPSVLPASYRAWLSYLNRYRTMARLPGVTEDVAFSAGCADHARYMVKNDAMAHTQEPDNPWYTPAGKLAAEASDLMGSHNPQESDQYAVDGWMQAPFHALGILDPRLRSVGYGAFREEDGGLQMAAALDVLRGLRGVPAGVRYPVMWPAPETTTPLTRHWSESPSPLSACPGYETPSGAPVILQLGTGEGTPVVTAHSFRQDGRLLESCVFDESTYSHPNANAQAVGRAVLGMRDAIVLMPRDPLEPGGRYQVSITADGRTYTWSFEVAAAAAVRDLTAGIAE
jgi:uncharacterized protein YkwD